MKLYVLAIVLIALVACGAPSVSQDEYDTLRRDFRQSTVDMNELRTQLSDSQDEVDAFKAEVRDLQNRLMNREQSTETIDMTELYAQLSDYQDEVDTLKAEVRDLENSLMNREQTTESVQESTLARMEPVFTEGQAIALVKDRIRNDFVFGSISYVDDPGKSNFGFFGQGSPGNNQERDEYSGKVCAPLMVFVSGHFGVAPTPQDQIFQFYEQYQGYGIWAVEFTGEKITKSHAGYPYAWKVYESTGTVERIAVDRDYC